MVSRKVIEEIYRKYRREPKPEQQQQIIKTLIDTVGETHHLTTDSQGFLIIGSLDEMSPFRRIMIRRIHGVAVFEKSAAIVLPNSIIFLNRKDDGVNIHFKPNPTSFWEKVKWWFRK